MLLDAPLALVVLVLVLIIVRIVRSMTLQTPSWRADAAARPGFAVMDAAAVDSHRRLVLVRRDDIEHLILIGGPTDVVVERDIRLRNPVRRPAAPAEAIPKHRSRRGFGQSQVAPRPEPRRVPAPAPRPEQPAPSQPAYRAPPPPPLPCLSRTAHRAPAPIAPAPEATVSISARRRRRRQQFAICAKVKAAQKSDQAVQRNWRGRPKLAPKPPELSLREQR